MLVEWLSDDLTLRRSYLLRLVASASHRYMQYSIAKRDGTPRVISHPSQELKAVQRWLLRRVITRFPVHDAAAAYVKGASIRLHALQHAQSKFLLRLDFERFFETITERDIEVYLSRHRELLPAHWAEEDDAAFCRLVCRHGALTIGAVTSPALSNALCYELDDRLSSSAQQMGVTYSRYADDLYFSTGVPGVLNELEANLPEVLSGVAYPRDLRINRAKTRHSSTKGRRMVTGITFRSSGGISLGRVAKRRVRSQIYLWETLEQNERRSLAGWLAYARSIEPDLLNRLILKFGPEAVGRAERG
jgi:RNA-directed DNA polymerase